MQYHHIGYWSRGFYQLANLGHGENMNHDAQHRLNILRFWEKHGRRPVTPFRSVAAP